jgi:hypothetical protein|tara:strand:+ start:1591 stop:2070 length:480 start_codon:yes stop_codon:yes gene_type:complete
MVEWEIVLDSPYAESSVYCSWEEYIRHIALERGVAHAATDVIYPIMGFDKNLIDEAILVGFALVPTFQDESKSFCGLFFDYDDVEIFDDFIEYVYEFEEHDTWVTDAEVLLYHNRAAVIHPKLQDEAEEFGFTEVVSAALKGQYEGYSSWATHPSDVEV